MTTNSAAMPIAQQSVQWTTRVPLTEQQKRTETATKQLSDQATKTFGRVLKKELEKLQPTK